MKPATSIIYLALVICLVPLSGGADQHNQPAAESNLHGTWQELAVGLELGIFSSPLHSKIGDSKIRALRIDPQHYDFRLLNASASENSRPLSAKEWCLKNGLVAAINASMYQKDYKSSVSFMRTKAHVNNPRLSKDMTILAFDRKKSDVPPVKIIDRQCENFKTWQKNYRTLVQSIRMISCTGKNVWSQQPQKWSTAAIGVDDQNRVLFIHVGSPYSTHDVIEILKKLPLNIARAMYTEGGPQAQLYINTGDQEYEFVGNYEIEINGNVKKLISRPIPNIVGIVAKPAKRKIE